MVKWTKLLHFDIRQPSIHAQSLNQRLLKAFTVAGLI